MANTRPKKSPVPTPSIEEGQNKTRKEVICSILKKKTKEKFLTQTQKRYYDTLIVIPTFLRSSPNSPHNQWPTNE